MNWLKHLMILAGCALPVLPAAEWWSPNPLEQEQGRPALIPFPKQVQWEASLADMEKNGAFEVQPLAEGEGWTLEGDGVESAMVQTAWEGLLAALPEQPPRRVRCLLSRKPIEAKVPTLSCMRDRSEEERLAESYILNMAPGRVQICAVTEAGLFYGLQTLRQLLADGGELGTVSIYDSPSFPMRGFHQDCGRNFQSIESLKRQIDLASQLKLNYFHWHFTDYPAYHLECKKYPQLNAPEHRTRDKADTYSYDDVRDLIAYAKARHVTVIPEIDMPGHSDYFVRAFGFEMHTEQGMRVLEDILDEFCAEVPDCPIFHIGADEVRVPNAEEFVQRMSLKLREHGRETMQWEGPWDLPVGKSSIAQRWVQGKSSQEALSIRQRTVDSSIGYSNLLDPALLVRRWFFMRPCGVSLGDALRLGAIFCTWPDRRVADKSLIPLQSPQWPGMCAMAERVWVGGSSAQADAFATDMPAPDTEAARAFASFERRMESLRRTVFKDEYFPYWPEHGRENIVVGPVPMEQVEAVRAKVLAGDLAGLPVRKAYGGSLYFHTAPGAWNLGMFSQVQPGHCVWVITQVHAEAEGEAPFMVGFDAPLRSHQYYTGKPEPGKWSQCGTRVWLNGAEIANPKVLPGAEELVGADMQSICETRRTNAELPLENSEIWWTQSPTCLPLKQGQNTFVIEQPYVSRIQSWSVSLIPLAP